MIIKFFKVFIIFTSSFQLAFGSTVQESTNLEYEINDFLSQLIEKPIQGLKRLDRDGNEVKMDSTEINDVQTIHYHFTVEEDKVPIGIIVRFEDLNNIGNDGVVSMGLLISDQDFEEIFARRSVVLDMNNVEEINFAIAQQTRFLNDTVLKIANQYNYDTEKVSGYIDAGILTGIAASVLAITFVVGLAGSIHTQGISDFRARMVALGFIAAIAIFGAAILKLVDTIFFLKNPDDNLGTPEEENFIF